MNYPRIQLIFRVFLLLFMVNPCAAAEVVKSNRGVGLLDVNGLPKEIKAPTGKRISAEELQAKREEIEKRRKFVVIGNGNIPLRKSIYDGSTILVSNGQHTVLPEGAVIFIPDHLKSRVAEKPVGKFVLWPDFLRANRGWIRTLEVSIDQAKGVEPVNEQRSKVLRSAGVVVVSQYNKQPVSFRGSFEPSTEENPQ